jgi:hypothetical protein
MKVFAMSYGTKAPLTAPQCNTDSSSRLKHARRLTWMSAQVDRPVDGKRNRDRYVVLARDAETAGDQIEAERLYQYAEHYRRLMRQAADGRRVPQLRHRSDHPI